MTIYSTYDCEFASNTLNRVVRLFGENSDEYKAAKIGDARGLVKLLNIHAYPRHLRVSPELAGKLQRDPALFIRMIDRQQRITKLARCVDEEWLQKCPKEKEIRAIRRRLTENKMCAIAS